MQWCGAGYTRDSKKQANKTEKLDCYMGGSRTVLTSFAVSSVAVLSMYELTSTL